MVAVNRWPIDKFGQDLTKAIPQSIQNVNGNRIVTPSLIILPGNDPQISITSGGTYTLLAGLLGDILINTAALVTIQLPLSSTRGFNPVTVVDVGGNASSFEITIARAGSDLIMGQTSLALSSAYGGYTLWPILAGGGWYQK